MDQLRETIEGNEQFFEKSKTKYLKEKSRLCTATLKHIHRGNNANVTTLVNQRKQLNELIETLS